MTARDRRRAGGRARADGPGHSPGLRRRGHLAGGRRDLERVRLVHPERRADVHPAGRDPAAAAASANGPIRRSGRCSTGCPGGLLHTNIAVCTLFGAVSGSSMSTAAAVGSVAYPEMVKRGYDKDVVVGSLAGGGTLGLLIPPSLSLLIFGALTETSIGRLVPRRDRARADGQPRCSWSTSSASACGGPSLAPRSETRSGAGPVTGRPAAGLADPVALFAVMGSIVFGWATPTEAAGVGVVLAAIADLMGAGAI